ncbi:MAG: hypothetical protein KGJ06_09970, partial [Pseudomonadota bacterium]|nr:hypothetical protein [Pseudomonadota bacterium]
GTIGKQASANNLIGLLRPYKPVSVGSTLSSAAEQDFTYSGVALKPYNPVQITGSRDISGNLTITWIRRSRLAPGWQDYVDSPLNEASEAYEIDIMNGSSVARTLTGLASPTAGYTAAQQTTDFGSPQSSVTVNVYQLSAIVGRGYAGNASV